MSGRMPYGFHVEQSTTTRTRRTEIQITEEERSLEQAAATAGAA